MTPDGFSDVNPTLRLAWDATCLASYMRDPLAYYWTHVLGYRHASPALAPMWGTLWHEATAFYRKMRATTKLRGDTPLIATIMAMIEVAKERDLAQVVADGKKADMNKRNLYTLVRSLIWWVERYKNDWAIPLLDAKDEPMIELHFEMPLGAKAYTGEDYILCGSLDEIVQNEDGEPFVLERKSTTTTLGQYYWYKFDPCVQTWTYDLVGSFLLPGKALEGVVVEACQTAVGFTRFDRHYINRTDEQREHWLNCIRYWIWRAEQDAKGDSWKYAMNPETTQFNSVHKEIQRRTPSHWEAMLKSELRKQGRWNPLEAKQ